MNLHYIHLCTLCVPLQSLTLKEELHFSLLISKVGEKRGKTSHMCCSSCSKAKGPHQQIYVQFSPLTIK